MGASQFKAALSTLQDGRTPQGRRWVYVPYDQLGAHAMALGDMPAHALNLVFVESSHKPSLRDYHQQKLVLVASNMRHFALEQAKKGAYVLYRFSDRSYGETLAKLRDDGGLQKDGFNSLCCAEPAERELREDLKANAPFVSWEPHRGFLTTDKDFDQVGKLPWRMDKFYAHLRRRMNIMMDGGRPAGGKFSHDADNRQPYRGDPPTPSLPQFTPDRITQEVIDLVKERFGDHMGRIDPHNIPSSHKDAIKLWAWAKENCLENFGPFEDAMNQNEGVLFHTTLSGLLNLQRLNAHEVLREVLMLPGLSLASREGFVRQLLGWREFVRHVHRRTNGLKDLPHQNFLQAKNKLPSAYWGKKSGLNCLDTVVNQVMETGYSHHITRLMVLSNIATLLGYSPRELTDWFWCAYVDAYDWVVEPNVLGMGTFALGDAMMTKPYVSGAPYIDRMSDYCAQCSFSPKKNCPITPLYWHFLARHHDKLRQNPRIFRPMQGLARRSAGKQEHDRRIFKWAVETLAQGHPLKPKDLPGEDT